MIAIKHTQPHGKFIEAPCPLLPAVDYTSKAAHPADISVNKHGGGGEEGSGVGRGGSFGPALHGLAAEMTP